MYMLQLEKCGVINQYKDFCVNVLIDYNNT